MFSVIKYIKELWGVYYPKQKELTEDELKILERMSIYDIEAECNYFQDFANKVLKQKGRLTEDVSIRINENFEKIKIYSPLLMKLSGYIK